MGGRDEAVPLWREVDDITLCASSLVKLTLPFPIPLFDLNTSSVPNQHHRQKGPLSGCVFDLLLGVDWTDLLRLNMLANQSSLPVQSSDLLVYEVAGI